MPTPIVLPKQGNSVESCLITTWMKQPGDPVQAGDVLVEIETDKALMTVESDVDGVLLARFFEEGDDVPVMTNIAVVGEQGEDVEPFRPEPALQPTAAQAAPSAPQATQPERPVTQATQPNGDLTISPRALRLAQSCGVDYAQLRGTGPEGRIVERDVQAAIDTRPPTTRAARRAATLPTTGTGIGGRVTHADLDRAHSEASPPSEAAPDEIEAIPVNGIRRRIADNMHRSLQEMAQLTLNTTADASALLAYRKRLKTRDDLAHVSINALVLYAVARTLPGFPALNATFDGDIIRHYGPVNLGFAVDLPRGLIVPIVRHADRLSLAALATEANRLAEAAQAGKVLPDELRDGTFTVSNLGSLGIETFTPIINPPQVAILGVGTTTLKPVLRGDTVEHVPHLNLSLTIDHRALDGAPAARFLAALRANIADIELVLAL